MQTCQESIWQFQFSPREVSRRRPLAASGSWPSSRGLCPTARPRAGHRLSRQEGASVSAAARPRGCARKQSHVRFTTRGEGCCEGQSYSSDSVALPKGFSLNEPWMLVGNFDFDFLHSWARMELSAHSESTAQFRGRQQVELKVELGKFLQGAHRKEDWRQWKGLAGWHPSGEREGAQHDQVPRHGDSLGSADVRASRDEAGEEIEDLELGRERWWCSCKSKGNLCRRRAQIRGPRRKRKKRNRQVRWKFRCVECV